MTDRAAPEIKPSDELKPSEVAVILGVAETTIRAWLRDGILPARRTRPRVGGAKRAGHWRIRRDDVEALRQQSFKPDARVLKRQAQEDSKPPTA
jgi:excisionase family DNA binding protein